MKWVHDMKRVFRRLTPAEMAARELADAELARLEALSATEYAEAMATYHQRRIERLKGFLSEVAQ